MVKFSSDESLGKTIAASSMWSFGYEPLEDLEQLRFAAGGTKFGMLCAFKFKSALASHQYPWFQIAYVPKITHSRQKSKNIPCWYIYKKIGAFQIDVLSPEQLLANYGFDVYKFFDSDVFKLSVLKFMKLIRNGLNVQVPALIKKLDADQAAEAQHFAAVIEAALKEIDKAVINTQYFKLYAGSYGESELSDSELDKKIEAEAEKIYGPEEESEQIEEKSYDMYDWKDGSLTGKGLREALDDSWQHVADFPVKVYDRKTGADLSIVDITYGSQGKGLILHIDSSKMA